jgi:hypothetical protein
MAFCPSCKAEYRSGFERCADCSVALVDSLPEPEKGDPTPMELAELATFPNPAEAAMIRELLEENGITTVLRDDFFGYGGAAATQTLLVNVIELPAAEKVYEEYFAGEAEELPAEEPDEDIENPAPKSDPL